jgi:hypothetical protein
LQLQLNALERQLFLFSDFYGMRLPRMLSLKTIYLVLVLAMVLLGLVGGAGDDRAGASAGATGAGAAAATGVRGAGAATTAWPITTWSQEADNPTNAARN